VTQWGEIIDEIALRYGWTYEQIGELTPTQVGMVQRGGKERDRGTTVDNPVDALRLFQERRKFWYGD
jgi:hypothetical protein